MKVFYTGSDIEEIAASGVRRLEIGPGVTLTDVARETAEALGITLVTAGESAPAAPTAPAPATNQSDKPSGCQHGPLPGAPTSGATSASATHSDGIVDRLVNIVSRLADREE